MRACNAAFVSPIFSFLMMIIVMILTVSVNIVMTRYDDDLMVVGGGSDNDCKVAFCL